MHAVVIAHGSFPDTRLETEALATIDATVVHMAGLQSVEAREAARSADALMVTIEEVDADLIRSLENCKIIARVGTGLDAIDIPVATERGIWVTNVADYSIDEVSTHAIALLLNQARRLRQMVASVKAGAWYDAARIEPAPRLKGQVLGIIGLGRIGRTVAEKASGLGLRIIAYDPYVALEPDIETKVELVDLGTLFGESDYISLHTPLTESSRHIIDAAALDMMKPTAYLINTARGELIDDAALLEAVKAGRIAGAALDVLSVEPPPADFPLFQDERILITPHGAWYSEASKLDVRRKATEDVMRVLTGKKPLSPVNQPSFSS
ncbi:MAG: C-terminal binding protein [Chloroflexi bacterium]|nr:C-terminal binding protein [Chloroflexota bacterium]